MTYNGGKESLVCFGAAFGIGVFWRVCFNPGKHSFGSTGTRRDVIGLRSLAGRLDSSPSGLSVGSAHPTTDIHGPSGERSGYFETRGELSGNTGVTCLANGFRGFVGAASMASGDADGCLRLSLLSAIMFATSLTAPALRLSIRAGPLKRGRSRCRLYEAVFVARGLSYVSRTFQGRGGRTTASESGPAESNRA